MKIPRIMISAVKSGSGKTVVTTALMRALSDQGRRISAFKAGPDYIDPMFHERVLNIPSINLDTYFTGERLTRELFVRQIRESGSDMAVMEGVMGLFDGVGGVEKTGSTYHLSQVTKTPVILVIDAKGMAKTIVTIIKGIKSYDESDLIKGVILNRTGRGMAEILIDDIESETGVKLLGTLPDDTSLSIESRYLGLTLPFEDKEINEKINRASDLLIKNVDIEEVMRIASDADSIDADAPFDKYDALSPVKKKVKIAVAYDEAFCFYYKDNLRLLESFGAKLEKFSPIHDAAVPPDADGILFGGGYPEKYAHELSKNKSMLKSLREKYKANSPFVAECGGYMYLHESMRIENSGRYDMAGIIPGECAYTGKLVRFGYVSLWERSENYLSSGDEIRGHEFHYYDSTCNGDSVVAVKPHTGKTYGCVVETGNSWMGFPHLYYPSNPDFAKSFVEKAVRYHDRVS